MGRLKLSAGAAVYVDTDILIYHLEGDPRYSAQLERLKDLTAFEGVRLFTSELSICEALVPAQRNRDLARLATYLEFFESRVFVELIPTSWEIYVDASRVRADLGMKTPDAIHVASAIGAGCVTFITNDLSIRTPPPLALVPFGDL